MHLRDANLGHLSSVTILMLDHCVPLLLLHLKCHLEESLLLTLILISLSPGLHVALMVKAHKLILVLLYLLFSIVPHANNRLSVVLLFLDLSLLLINPFHELDIILILDCHNLVCTMSGRFDLVQEFLFFLFKFLDAIFQSFGINFHLISLISHLVQL